jgi:hypothetical protein
MKTEKLQIPYEDIFDFKLVGISCAEKDYRLCWAINQSLGIDLVRMSNEGIASRSHLLEFPFYEFESEETAINYRLLANRFENNVLMKELKTIDYLFLIQGEDVNLQDIMLKLGKIEFVFLATEIEIENLKDKDLLYLDE